MIIDILQKYSNTINHHATIATKHCSDETMSETAEYFQNRQQYGTLINKHVYVKSFQKRDNNLLNDQITMELMPTKRSSINALNCLEQWKLFWNS